MRLFLRLTRFFYRAALAIPAFVLLSTSALGATEFWVSPFGSDMHPGSKDAPFQTLIRARDAVRNVDPPIQSDIVVHLSGGLYRLQEPLHLDARDSGKNGTHVVWQAADGEKPIICGSVRIQGWRPLPGYENVYAADIPPGIRSRQLFVNGRRAVRAATTDFPTSFLPNGRQGILYGLTHYNDPAWANPATWENAGETEAVLISQWKMMICGVKSVQPDQDQQTGRLIMENPAWLNANMFYSQDLFHPDVFGPGLWSFWQVARFENSLSFLDLPGEWALDSQLGKIYYMPRAGEDMACAEVELPVLETLIAGLGAPDAPVTNIRFQGLTFCRATWLRPGSSTGYVTDQSGVHLVGGQTTNTIGHIRPNPLESPPLLSRTPGNIRLAYARNIEFRSNVFQQLGGAALDFGTGSQGNIIRNNRFTDIAAAAVQIGGIGEIDHHPPSNEYAARDNVIFNNLIQRTGRDYVDSAAIFVGCTTRTTIQNNTITDVPWSGIAMGWGWGLLDPESFPGLPGAYPGMWGFFDAPSATAENKILYNRIERFLQELWDGGAIYTTGHQGSSFLTGTLIMGNVALDKRPKAGGNVFYTDGGSRYLILIGNVSFNNPPGTYYFGPHPKMDAPFPYSPLPSLANDTPYGRDIGGCRTYGDILYLYNFWEHDSYFNICPYTDADGTEYPTRLEYVGNRVISSLDEVPVAILLSAGIQEPVP